MALAWCPKCDQLVGISPTGEKKHDGFSAEWQRLDLHAEPDPDQPDQKRICAASGKKI